MQEREKEQCDWKVSKPKQHHHTRNSHQRERERGQEGNMRVGRINQQPVPKASPAPPTAAAWYCFFDRIEEALKHHNEREREQRAHVTYRSGYHVHGAVLFCNQYQLITKGT